MSTVLFRSRSVANLQRYLRERGVTFSDSRKPALVELCSLAEKLRIEVDPDGLLEDRSEVVCQKLILSDMCLVSPQRLSGTSDLSIVPVLSIFDIYNYLITLNNYDHASLRAYHQLEGYSMFRDGYTRGIETVPYPNTAFVAMKANVKPRANDTDPISKRGYYSCWIMMKNSDEGSIQSAYCSCKGGIDQCCRHVVATLFEVLDFVQDFNKTSCTSGPCM